MVCRKISGKDGIPDPASVANNTLGSNRGSSELQKLISISLEGFEEEREEERQAIPEGEESEEVFRVRQLKF